jgi:hypothetical protein
MEIKFQLDTEKVMKATVAIVASYGLGRVSKGINYPQLALPMQLHSSPSLQSFMAPAWRLKQSKPT